MGIFGSMGRGKLHIATEVIGRVRRKIICSPQPTTRRLPCWTLNRDRRGRGFSWLGNYNSGGRQDTRSKRGLTFGPPHGKGCELPQHPGEKGAKTCHDGKTGTFPPAHTTFVQNEKEVLQGNKLQEWLLRGVLLRGPRIKDDGCDSSRGHTSDRLFFGGGKSCLGPEWKEVNQKERVFSLPRMTGELPTTRMRGVGG